MMFDPEICPACGDTIRNGARCICRGERPLMSPALRAIVESIKQPTREDR